MYEERVLQNLGEAFRHGRHFDKIVIALAKASAHRPLNEEDQQALEIAVNFMESAKRGCGWIDKPSVSEESKNCANSFLMAAQCIKEKHEPSKFIAELDLMVKTLESIKSGKKTRVSALNQASEFFDLAFQASIETIDNVLHKKPKPISGGAKWSLISAA